MPGVDLKQVAAIHRLGDKFPPVGCAIFPPGKRPKLRGCQLLAAKAATPAAYAAAFERSSRAALVCQDASLAEAIRAYTTRPVVTSIQDVPDIPPPNAAAQRRATEKGARIVGYRSALRNELYFRSRSLPDRTALAPTVTLACVDCVSPDTAAAALDLSRRGCKFARVLLLSHERPSVLPPDIDWVQIPELSLIGYQRFCLRELWRYTHTYHVLTIESDGWIFRPERWDPGWLEYDYIGAPWQKVEYAKRTRVGNSGCCLRSRKLLLTTARLSTDERIKYHFSHTLLVDVFTCYDLYDDVIAAGCRFAPADVAARFAIEKPTEFGADLTDCFAYHGKEAEPTAYVREEVHRWRHRTAWRAAGGRLRVVYNHYQVSEHARRAELDAALKALQENPHIDQLILVDGRPSFQELVDRANDGVSDQDITVILNSDCFLDHTAADFACLRPSEFWSLTRHELTRDGWELWEVPYSQDAWAWRGSCRLQGCDFLPGTMGCDSVMTYRAYLAGYAVSNPAKAIRVCHLHAGEQRTALTRLPGPYMFVHPHELLQRSRWQIDMAPMLPPEPAVWRPNH